MNSLSLQQSQSPLLKKLARAIQQLPRKGQLDAPDYHEKEPAFNMSGSRMISPGVIRCDCGEVLKPVEGEPATCDQCDRQYDATGELLPEGRQAQAEISSNQYAQAQDAARESSGDFQRFVDVLAQKADIRYQNLQPAAQKQLARCFSDANPHQSGTAGMENYQRTAQKQYPARFKGHMIRVKSDGGGGHKASVYRENELKHVTKRHADPENAAHAAKTWVEDNSPARDPKPAKKRKAQVGLLQNPNDSSVVNADSELESIRQQAQVIQQKVNDVMALAQSYSDALANKAGAPDSGGMMGLQQEAGRLQTELETKLRDMPGNFIRFSDNVTFCKVQTVRLNAPAWDTMLSVARERGQGVMKRVVGILDKLSVLFQKLTVAVKIEEVPSGELTPKKVDKVVKKNKDSLGKIEQYQQEQKNVAPRAQKYFLDTGTGKMGVPGT